MIVYCLAYSEDDVDRSITKFTTYVVAGLEEVRKSYSKDAKVFKIEITLVKDKEDGNIS